MSYGVNLKFFVRNLLVSGHNLLNISKRMSCASVGDTKNEGQASQIDVKFVFSQKFNPTTGQVEWETLDDKYDFHQEIARSAYADMLHDTERNQKYFAGLKWAIARLREQGQPVRVLDIGTGTGLLSMMAASLGADDITACEAFMPVSECAKKVISGNGFADKIRLIAKRSTDLTVGPDGDMPQRANLLVTEVLDTELIGEGAISTYNHAHKHLLQKGSLVVPARAIVYAQAVESRLLRNWNRPSSLALPDSELTIEPPDDIATCPGSAAVLDLQMSRLPDDSFQCLSDPVPVAKFDFSCANDMPIPLDECLLARTMATAGGRVDAFLFWWDIDMTADSRLKLSCAPWWIHDQVKEQPWRDHWMQAVYFPRRVLDVQNGHNFVIQCSHDEYSFWFDALPDQDIGTSADVTVSSATPQPIRRPTCTCGYHVVCNPFRIGAINDSRANNKYISVLQKLIGPNSVCLCLGDGGSLLPLMAAKLGARKVYVVDNNSHSSKVLASFVDKNGLQDIVRIIHKNVDGIEDSDMDGEKVDLILSEPYYMSSLLPWHNLLFAYQLARLASKRASHCPIMPRGATLWAIGVSFKHLWKIRSPLHEVEGFSMQHFDGLIQSAIGIADPPVEPHPLWEYEGIAVTDSFSVAKYDFTKTLESLNASGTVSLKSQEPCNGVALWMEWHLDEETSVAGGPSNAVKPGAQLHWDPNSKQAVHFLTSPV